MHEQDDTPSIELHTATIKYIDVISKKVDQLEGIFLNLKKASEATGDMLKFITDEQLKQKARMDDLQKEILGIKQKLSL